MSSQLIGAKAALPTVAHSPPCSSEGPKNASDRGAAFRLNPPPTRRCNGSGAPLATLLSTCPRAATTSTAPPTSTTGATPGTQVSPSSRGSHYLPQLILTEETRNSPLSPYAGSAQETSTQADGFCDRISPSPPGGGDRVQANAASLAHSKRLLLLPLSPLALPPASAAKAALAARSPTAGTTAASTPTNSTALQRPRHDLSTHASPGAVSGYAKSLQSADAAGEERHAPPTALTLAKAATFEQRRIPLPPPAMTSGAVGDSKRSTNNIPTPIGKSTFSAGGGAGRGATTAPSTSLSATEDTHAPGTAAGRLFGRLSAPSGCGASATSTAASACRVEEDGAAPHSPTSLSAQRKTAPSTPGAKATSTTATTTTTTPSAVVSRAASGDGATATSPATRATLFNPVSLDTVSTMAPTSLRHTGGTPRPHPLPPVPFTAKADLADREHAQTVHDLLPWRRHGRHRQLLLRTRAVDDLRYAVPPVTVHASRPTHLLDRDGCTAADASCGEAVRATQLGKTLETAPSCLEAAVLASGPNASHGGTHELLEDAQRLMELASPSHSQHRRSTSARSHTSLVSRCSTPDAAGSDSGALLRCSDASPKHGGSGALRRSLPSDRLFARPSSTSLHTEVHREGSSWSRSEGGGVWGGSSRHLNASTLTISCAPALGSFSTNSDSSLIP